MTVSESSVNRFWNKSSPIFPKGAQKLSKIIFTKKVSVFQNSLEKLPSKWATFVTELVAKEFQYIAQSGRTDGD